MELSKRLKKLREDKKAPLRYVSERCGCSPQYLSQLENGAACRPAIDLLYRISAYYQFPSDTLILEAGKIPQDVYWKTVNTPALLDIIRKHVE